MMTVIPASRFLNKESLDPEIQQIITRFSLKVTDESYGRTFLSTDDQYLTLYINEEGLLKGVYISPDSLEYPDILRHFGYSAPLNRSSLFKLLGTPDCSKLPKEPEEHWCPSDIGCVAEYCDDLESVSKISTFTITH